MAPGSSEASFLHHGLGCGGRLSPHRQWLPKALLPTERLVLGSGLRRAASISLGALEPAIRARAREVKEPLNRCSAQEALQHPWLHPEDSPKHKGCRPERLRSLVERVASFARFSRFEQAILTVAAHEARPQDVEELLEVFHSLDMAQAGWISRDDLRRAFVACDVKMSKMEQDKVLDVLDPDKDAKIQHTDFLAATLMPSHVRSERVMEELFNFFDFQGFGEISHQDLKEVLGQEMACHVAVQAQADAHGVISKAPPGNDFDRTPSKSIEDPSKSRFGRGLHLRNGPRNFRTFILKAMNKLELQIQNEKSLTAMMVIS